MLENWSIQQTIICSADSSRLLMSSSWKFTDRLVASLRQAFLLIEFPNGWSNDRRRFDLGVGANNDWLDIFSCSSLEFEFWLDGGTQNDEHNSSTRSGSKSSSSIILYTIDVDQMNPNQLNNEMTLISTSSFCIHNLPKFNQHQIDSLWTEF